MSERHMFNLPLCLSHRARPHIQLELSMRSEVAAISPFADSFMRFIKGCRCALGIEREIEVALREALANAVVHGNQTEIRRILASESMSAVAARLMESRLSSGTKDRGLTLMGPGPY
jgi:hypothetical protein